MLLTACWREQHPFIGVFVSKTILFYKSEITRKDYLESVSETIELVNALQNEELLQIVCHTQAWTIRLEQLCKKYKVKLPVVIPFYNHIFLFFICCQSKN